MMFRRPFLGSLSSAISLLSSSACTSRSLAQSPLGGTCLHFGSFSPLSWFHSHMTVRAISLVGFARLERLESAANQSPYDVTAQLSYAEELARHDPEELIRRFESGQYASDERVRKEYLRALVRSGRVDRLPQRDASSAAGSVGFESRDSTSEYQHMSSIPPFASRRGIESMRRVESNIPESSSTSSFSRANDSPKNPIVGSSHENPIIVQIAEPSIASQIWRTLRAMILAVVLYVGVSTVLDERGIGGKAGIIASKQYTEILPSSDQVKRFDDVKGVDEAKQELLEAVEFLKNPGKFTKLGGRLPKGLLLIGPPGTGKTLLAKAVAGEAGVPFFYTSGSDFEEMFVGVGARRIRDLFGAARRSAPCIVFIDEIDAVGAKRNPKDQQYMRMTLNQLLAEMDGFNSSEGVIVIGATNFPESLDKALTRPGRFDHQIVVPKPDVRGRQDVLDYYLKNLPVEDDVDTYRIARATSGFSGADLSNLVNTASIRAAVLGLERISMAELDFAIDKIMMGAERKTVVSENELKNTAFHEAGHAIVALHTKGAGQVHKATILARGSVLGMVVRLPKEGSYTLEEMRAHMDVAMGGRAAEEVVFGRENVTIGASSDFQSATNIAKQMIAVFGFNDKFGPVNLEECSPETMYRVEAEAQILCEEAYQRAVQCLKRHRKELELVANALLEYETLTGKELELLLRGEPIRVIPGLPVVEGAASAQPVY